MRRAPRYLPDRSGLSRRPARRPSKPPRPGPSSRPASRSGASSTAPRLDDNLGVALGRGKVLKCLCDSFDADLGGDQRGDVDFALGNVVEGGGELLGSVTEDELEVEFLVDAEHRLKSVALHAYPDHHDPRLRGRI